MLNRDSNLLFCIKENGGRRGSTREQKNAFGSVDIRKEKENKETVMTQGSMRKVTKIEDDDWWSDQTFNISSSDSFNMA